MLHLFFTPGGDGEDREVRTTGLRLARVLAWLLTVALVAVGLGLINSALECATDGMVHDHAAR